MVDKEHPQVKAVLEEFEKASDADKQARTESLDSFNSWLTQHFGQSEILAQYAPALLQLLRSIGG